eukprot:905487-Rhodomonas_salina.1
MSSRFLSSYAPLLYHPMPRCAIILCPTTLSYYAPLRYHAMIHYAIALCPTTLSSYAAAITYSYIPATPWPYAHTTPSPVLSPPQYQRSVLWSSARYAIASTDVWYRAIRFLMTASVSLLWNAVGQSPPLPISAGN